MELKTYIADVLFVAEERWDRLHRDFPRLRTKLYSELISNILEDSFRSVVPGCRVGTSDGEADIYIYGEPLEIKTAANSRKWRGGDFSKRPGEYVLVGYELDGRFIRWFVVQTVLTESEWKSSGSKNYYATSIDLDYILTKPETEILWGSVQKKRKLTHPVYEEAE